MVATLQDAYGADFGAPPPAAPSEKKRKRRDDDASSAAAAGGAAVAASAAAAAAGPSVISSVREWHGGCGNGCPTELFYLLALLLVANLVVSLRTSAKLDALRYKASDI